MGTLPTQATDQHNHGNCFMFWLVGG